MHSDLSQTTITNSSRLTLRNLTGVLLLAAALLCLYPGITQPLLQIQVVAKMPLVGSLELYNEIQSITQSIKALWQSNHRLVAGLIFLFSIIVPLIKALLLIISLGVHYLSRSNSCGCNVLKRYLLTIVQVIGKWSMADVFVVSIFMAFLATKSNDYIEAILHSGFYYFLSYCVLSILASLFISTPLTNSANTSISTSANA